MPDPCPRCRGDRFLVVVPDALSDYVPASTLACCDRCLAADPGEASLGGATDDDLHGEVTAGTDPPLDRLCRRFPTGDGGVALVVLFQQLDSLALNRAAIESLVGFLEANGVDLFLTLDRLLEEPTVEPYFDLERRRDQLAELLD